MIIGEMCVIFCKASNHSKYTKHILRVCFELRHVSFPVRFRPRQVYDKYAKSLIIGETCLIFCKAPTTLSTVNVS